MADQKATPQPPTPKPVPVHAGPQPPPTPKPAAPQTKPYRAPVAPFPGTGALTPPSPSTDPVLSVGSAMGMARNVALDELTRIQQDGQVSGAATKWLNELSGSMTTIMSQVVNDVLSQVKGSGALKDALLGTQGGADLRTGRAPLARTAPTNPVAGPAPVRAPTQARPTLTGSPLPVSEGADLDTEQPQTIHGAFSEGRAQGSKLTMTDVWHKSMGTTSRVLQGYEGRYHLDTTTASDGYLGDYINATTGERVTGSAARRIGTGLRIASGASRIMGSMAAGEGIGGTLGAVATKVAGPIGVAVGVGMKVASTLENQNQAGAEYRSDFGQSGTGLYSAKDRFSEWLNSWSGFGTIGRGRAEAEFKAASAMGMRGDRRDQATGFMRDMYQKFGMDTGESSDYVQRTIDQAGASLGDFTKALEAVSASAVKAGRSSRDAISDFAKAQAVFNQNGPTGDQATNAAAMLSQQVSGLPSDVRAQLGGAEGLATALSNYNTRTYLAGQQGIGSGAAIYDSLTNAKDSEQHLLDQFYKNIVGYSANLVGMSSDAFASRFVAAANQISGNNPGPEACDQAMLQLARSRDAAGRALYSVLQYVNHTLSATHVTQGGVSRVIYEACVKWQQDKSSNKPSSHGSSGPQDRSPVGNKMPLPTDYIHMGKDMPEFAYEALSGKFGNRHDPVLDKILDSKDAMKNITSISGTQNIEQTKFRVQTGNGYKSMTLSEIIKDPKALSHLSGAEIVGGPGHTSESLASVLNISSNASANSDLVKALSKGIKIGLTDEARRLHKIVGPSDAQRRGVPESPNR